MIDTKYLRENLLLVEEGIRKKKFNCDLDIFVDLDEKRRAIIGAAEKARACQKAANTEMAKLEKGSSDFYLITKKVRDQIINSNISFNFLRGFIHWSGFSKLYITYVPNKRIHGKSKYGFIKQLEFALTGVYFYQSKFFVYLFLISLFLFFTALIYIFYIIYSFYFAGSIEQTGWSTLVIILLFFGSFIILLNSFVIFIIMKIFNFVSNKPNFIIDDEK